MKAHLDHLINHVLHFLYKILESTAPRNDTSILIYGTFYYVIGRDDESIGLFSKLRNTPPPVLLLSALRREGRIEDFLKLSHLATDSSRGIIERSYGLQFLDKFKEALDLIESKRKQIGTKHASI